MAASECQLEQQHNGKDVLLESSSMVSSIPTPVFVHLESQFHQNQVQPLPGMLLLTQSRVEAMWWCFQRGCEATLASSAHPTLPGGCED